MRKLTRDQQRDIRAIAAKRDEDIDFSDAAPVLDWGAAEIGEFYRPMHANWVLRSAMLHFTREANDGRRKRHPAAGKASRRRKQG